MESFSTSSPALGIMSFEMVLLILLAFVASSRSLVCIQLTDCFPLFSVLKLSGMVLIGLSIYVNFRGAVLTKVLGLSSAYLFHVGCLCLVMGSVTVLLGFARRHGAAKESRGTLLFVSCICTQTPQLLHHV